MLRVGQMIWAQILRNHRKENGTTTTIDILLAFADDDDGELCTHIEII